MSSSLFTRLQLLFSKSSKHISSSTSPISTPLEIQQLVEKFNKNSNFASFRRNHAYYESTVRRLAAGKHYSAIESIIEYQKKFKYMSQEVFGAILIKLYGNAGMFDNAYKVFDELPKFDCPRTSISFNALLSACVKSKKLDKIGEIFEEMPLELGIEPDIYSYNTMIKGLCELNDFRKAMELMEKMEDGPVKPNIVSYNTVLEAYYKENNLEEAGKWLRKMEVKGVVANVRTYNARLRSLVQNDQVLEALELVEKLVNENKVNPDAHTYNAVIRGCVDKEILRRAKMLHGRMATKECQPDHTTYQMLIPFACEEGDIDFAFQLCKQAVELKVHVFRTLMQLVVDGLVKRSKIDEANELVALARSSKNHQYTLTLPVTSLVD